MRREHPISNRWKDRGSSWTGRRIGSRARPEKRFGAAALLVATIALVAWGWGSQMRMPPNLRNGMAVISWPFGPRVVVDGVRINPAASINPNRSYTITLWDQPIPLPPKVGSYEGALQEAIAAFRVEYPNVEVSVRLWDRTVLRDQASSAGAEGVTLPDIVGGPLNYPSHPARQVPVESYLDDAARREYRPGTLSSVSDETHIWGWPAWFDWTAGAIKPRSAAAADGGASPQGKAHLDLVGERLWSGVVQWAWEQTSDPVRLGETVEQLLSTWAEEGLVPSGRRADAIEETLGRVGRTRLTRFTRAEGAMTAPVTPLIARYWTEENVALLPFPTLSAEGVRVEEAQDDQEANGTEGMAYVPMQPVGYAVLVGEPFAGSDHIQVAMTVANHLSEEMGAWLAERVPYLAARTVDDEILPDDWERLLTGALAKHPPRYLTREAFSARDEMVHALKDQVASIVSGARSVQEAIDPPSPPDGVQW